MTIQNVESNEPELRVYRELQQTLDEEPNGFFPPTKSGIEIRLLKRLFTPKEAKIASKLKFHWKDWESLENIYERLKPLGYSKEELETHLDKMIKKGAIAGRREGENKLYSLPTLMDFYMFTQVNKLTKGFIEDLNQYIQEGWGTELLKISVPIMRTIPIGLDLNHDVGITNYNDIKQLFENVEGPFSIINCVCRQAKDILGDPCHATSRREVCMGFGNFAKSYIDAEWGREITKEEALEILTRNEEEGLVFQPSNSQKLDFVCSCCTCCCGGLNGIKQLPNPANFVTTDYYAEVDPDFCIGCGTCIDRCLMDAISLVEDISTVNRKRCIGCGNCVFVCQDGAIQLKKKDRQHVPPLTGTDLYDQIAKVGAKIKAKELRKKQRQENRSKL
ncbi:MAG: 4Fe-4S binding protein [Promethearchaeota archaeon]|jgi:Na+-translocating ferredoxin:NAD+ oxidoreductase RNF subunit RnfB